MARDTFIFSGLSFLSFLSPFVISLLTFVWIFGGIRHLHATQPWIYWKEVDIDRFMHYRFFSDTE